MPTFSSYFTFVASQSGPFALVIGNFDGVHCGHQALIAHARQHLVHGPVAVLTFHPHPAAVLSPHNAPTLLSSPKRKRELLFQAGAQHVIEHRFDEALAQLGAADFIDQVLLCGPAPRVLVVGHDFRFGKGRVGDATLLGSALSGLGTHVLQLSAVRVPQPGDEPLLCSSTAVRKAILDGELRLAARLLGRLPEVEGVVKPGHGRGKSISFPTANLGNSSGVLPKPGVYAAWAELLGAANGTDFREVLALHPAAVNIGYNPTFRGALVSDKPELSVEAHLVLAPGQKLPPLYGNALRLCFLARLRDEKRFSQVADLVAQIGRDVATVQQLVSETPRGGWPGAPHGGGVTMGFTKETDKVADGLPPTPQPVGAEAQPKRRPPPDHHVGLPETYGRDEIEVMTKDPFSYFVYWEVTDAGLAQAQKQLGLPSPTDGGEGAGDTKLVLRNFLSVPGIAGREQREIRDTVLHHRHGKKTMETPKPLTQVRAAVGLLSAEGLFVPIAQSQTLRLPPQQPAVETSTEWAHVQPVTSDGDGRGREHIVFSPAAHQERVLPSQKEPAGASSGTGYGLAAEPPLGQSSGRFSPGKKDPHGAR